MALGLALRELQNIHPVPTVLDRGCIVFSRRSWNGVHRRAHVRGVLSFDLSVESLQVEREALDRWYGANKTPDVHHKPSLMLAEQ